MNDPVDIELLRGQAGLGFNIKGGVDIPHIEGDPGIFVAKIRERGAAADDGRLHEGDKILEINGHNIEKVQHEEAVSYFLSAGNSVKLRVIPGAEEYVKSSQSNTSNNNSAKRPDRIHVFSDSDQGISYTSLALAGIGLAAAVFLCYRFLPKNR